MPRTVSSEYSLLNSFSHEAERSLARHRRISKRKSRNLMRSSKLSRPRRKAQRGKITVYSPEYAIRISEVSTPLYHSDEHTPSVSAPLPAQSSFRSYIDEAVLRKVCKEEYEQMELVLRMRGCRIRGEESSC